MSTVVFPTSTRSAALCGAGAHDQRLMALVGCIHGIVLEFDGNAHYLNAWADDPALLAGPVETMIGRTIEDVLGPDKGAPFTAAVMRVYATGIIEQIEYPLDLDGGRRWFFADIKRVGSPATGMTVVLFARDITERKRTEEELARSEERYRLVAQTAQDVLWDWDVSTGAITWSAIATTVFRCAEVDERIEWWQERIHPDDKAGTEASLEEAVANGESAWAGSYRLLLGDGTYGEFMDRAFIVRGPGGEAVRIVGALTDVTEVNRLQAQLLQADRLAALGLLAAGVGHEINNPLTYVVGNLEEVLGTLDPAAHQTRELLEESLDGARRITDIVKTLKLFGKAEETSATPLAIEGAIEHAIRMTENQIRQRARLVRDFDRTPAVCGVESQLVQVFVNVLINATQSLPEDSQEHNEIRISTGMSACGRVVVRFQDTGCGIEANNLHRVFDPFFSTKLRGVGTGLGLSICQGILQKFGGEISISSEVDCGTTVSVFLPCFQPAARTLPRLLVIDDEIPIGRLIARMLRDIANVVVMTSAREALVHLEQDDDFDIVLCDLMMPGMTGMELYEELQRKHDAIVPRVRFMSGGAFSPRAQKFLDRTAIALIEKPLDSEELRSLMSSCSRLH